MCSSWRRLRRVAWTPRSSRCPMARRSLYLTDTPADLERTVGFRVADVDQALRELRDAGVSTDDEVSSTPRSAMSTSVLPTGISTSWCKKSADTSQPA